MTSAELVDELRKACIPPIQIEWEIEEYDKIRQPFGKISQALKTGEMKIGHVGGGLRQAIRPVPRWYNIMLKEEEKRNESNDE